VFLDMPVMQQPEVYISHANKLFDAAGKLTNDSTRDFFRTVMTAFAPGSSASRLARRSGRQPDFALPYSRCDLPILASSSR
jgi:NAD(P)H-dependent FMN reductase